MYFTDRTDAGKQLGKAVLEKYRNKDCIVYGLPRGGVVTAMEVAKTLKAPLDLLITRKIGHPRNPEYAIGAISEHGHIAKGVDFGEVDSSFIREAIAKEQEEIRRRKKVYLKNRKEKDSKGKVALIVDDGIATGLTMKAAIMEVKERHPEKIVVVAAVLPKEVEIELKKEVDDVISLFAPTDYLGSVGSYYESFPQVNDDEVIALVRDAPDPIIFGFDSQKRLVNSLLSISHIFHSGKFAVSHFPNKEVCITVEANVAKKDCIVVALPLSEKDIMELLLLCDTLKKEEARSITCILPYLPYSRQDANEKGKSQGYIWFGDMLRSSGVDQIITVDVHNGTLIDFSPVSLTSISPAKIFAEKIQQSNLLDATLIAPDEGAKERCQEVATVLGKRKDITYCVKKREGTNVTSHVVGAISQKAIVVDDMLDTGNTLIACCRQLTQMKVSDITLFVTHGFFTGSDWKKIWEFPVSHIYCTDTVPLFVKDRRISVLSIEKNITAQIKELYV